MRLEILACFLNQTSFEAIKDTLAGNTYAARKRWSRIGIFVARAEVGSFSEHRPGDLLTPLRPLLFLDSSSEKRRDHYCDLLSKCQQTLCRVKDGIFIGLKTR